MGWAKYTEDNLEIMDERQRYTERKTDETWMRKSQNQCGPEKADLDVYAESVKAEVEDRWERNIASFLKAMQSDSTELTDKILRCESCGKEFVYPAEAQKRFMKKGWKPPKRCKACREYHQAMRLMHQSY